MQPLVALDRPTQHVFNISPNCESWIFINGLLFDFTFPRNWWEEGKGYGHVAVFPVHRTHTYVHTYTVRVFGA